MACGNPRQRGKGRHHGHARVGVRRCVEYPVSHLAEKTVDVRPVDALPDSDAIERARSTRLGGGLGPLGLLIDQVEQLNEDLESCNVGSFSCRPLPVRGLDLHRLVEDELDRLRLLEAKPGFEPVERLAVAHAARQHHDVDRRVAFVRLEVLDPLRVEADVHAVAATPHGGAPPITVAQLLARNAEIRHPYVEIRERSAVDLAPRAAAAV